ncbi:hypothetical protein GCM10020229_34220 [Kitasatospora albolonga]|uniref:hypothetical protein n=1 Tax=Kitasatospora albolonga TaxID=68173 RepID=UPI0031E939A8
MPALLEPALALLLRRSGPGLAGQARELLPCPVRPGPGPGVSTQQRLGAAPALDGAFVAAVLAPLALLLVAAVLAQLRRRAL